MLSKYEIAGIGVSVAIMAVALYMMRIETTLLGVPEAMPAATANSAAVVVAATDGGDTAARKAALLEAADANGNIQKLVIEDVKIGTGEEVKVGDTVSVHYVGRLQSGQEFDNSQKRGTPFEFTVGEGRVIKGWEEGLIGMKTGGQRILVIPPDMAYGGQQVGPIPPDSTLVFSIELLAIK